MAPESGTVAYILSALYIRLRELSLSILNRQLDLHGSSSTSLVCWLQVCDSYILSSGAVVTIVSSTPTTKPDSTQLDLLIYRFGYQRQIRLTYLPVCWRCCDVVRWSAGSGRCPLGVAANTQRRANSLSTFSSSERNVLTNHA